MILGHHLLRSAHLLSGGDEESIREAGLDLRLLEKVALVPGKFTLGLTEEIVNMSVEYLGFCNLRSTWARKGIFIPPTIVDPGFSGRLVIEMVNFGSEVIILEKGERFLHLIISACVGAIPYRGQYQGQYSE